MSLLVDMMADTLDSSYAEAAQRAAGERSRRPTAAPPVRRRTVLPLLLVLGVLTGTAAAQVRSQGQALDDERAVLAAEVAERTRQSDGLARALEQARAALAADQAEALGGSETGQQAGDRLAMLELAAAAVPVSGPGLVVRLDDAPQTDTTAEVRGGQAASGRVLDRDLQDAVNGLWAAGAEAVSVNGLRLNALTAIRSAGEAVLVDFRPLSPPYLVRAVGDAEGLERRFQSGATGRRLATYPGLYGIALEVRRARVLDLPAARLPDLRAVRTP